MRGGSLVRTRLSVRVKGSFPGSFVNVDRRGDTTLSELRQAEVLFKVGTSSYNWSTISAWVQCGREVSVAAHRFDGALF